MLAAQRKHPVAGAQGKDGSSEISKLMLHLQHYAADAGGFRGHSRQAGQ